MPTDDDDRPPPFSPDALRLMDLLMRRGGTMRIGPLLEACGLTSDALVAAVNELAERCWVSIVWRGPDARRPETLPARFREANRIVTTRFGRYRCRVTWPVY